MQAASSSSSSTSNMSGVDYLPDMAGVNSVRVSVRARARFYGVTSQLVTWLSHRAVISSQGQLVTGQLVTGLSSDHTFTRSDAALLIARHCICLLVCSIAVITSSVLSSGQWS